MAVRLIAICLAVWCISGAARAQDLIRVEIPSNVARCSATVLDLDQQGYTAQATTLPNCSLRVRGPNAFAHPFELAFQITPTYPQVVSAPIALRFIVPANVRPSLRGFTIRLPDRVTAVGLEEEIERRKGDFSTLHTKDLSEAWEYALWAHLTRHSTSNGSLLTTHDGRKTELETMVRMGCTHLRNTPPTASAMYASLQEGVLPLCRTLRGNAFAVGDAFNTSSQALYDDPSRNEEERRAEARALREAADSFAAETGLDRSVLAPTEAATAHVLGEEVTLRDLNVIPYAVRRQDTILQPPVMPDHVTPLDTTVVRPGGADVLRAPAQGPSGGGGIAQPETGGE
jgi:hypothetical protein